MKKKLKLTALMLTLLLIFTLGGCNSGDTESTVFKPESEIASSSQAPVSSIVSESSQESIVQPSQPQSSSQITSVYTPVLRDPIQVGEYTVTDPENARGLSNTKFGCHFGVAKNGLAAQPSINNQNRFNALQNVEALALDTVSQDKRMYLTFDCGYEYKNLTASILDTLNAKNVKAAFFCTLSYIKANPQLVSRMINEGHIVGNHSATHPTFTDISRTEMAKEIYLVDKYLGENYGYRTKYFRFPGGYHSDNTLELVTSVGHKSIFWSVAYADWDTANQPNHATAFETVTSRYHSGAVILLHAVSQTNTDILASLIDDAHSKGYSFKTLDDYYSS